MKKAIQIVEIAALGILWCCLAVVTVLEFLDEARPSEADSEDRNDLG